MPIHNQEIAEDFNRLADLLEIRGENPFRVRAYRSAARTIAALPRAVKEMLEDGEDLSDLPGIGDDLAGEIKEITETGHLKLLHGLRVLTGIEVDILEDGSLDLDQAVLVELDFVIGSIHRKFNLTKQKQTERVIRAMDHRCFNCLGHPTGLRCEPQLIGHITHYGSREALDIEHLGESTSRQLVRGGLVTNLADLYSLSIDDLMRLDGFAEKSAGKLDDAKQHGTQILNEQQFNELLAGAAA